MEVENEDQKHSIKADLQLGRAVFAPGRLERSPCTKELLHTVSVTSGETGFLCCWDCWVQVFSWWKTRHCFENNLCGVVLYLHVGILRPWGSCSHGFVRRSHKQGLSQYEKKKRELGNHIATARALGKKQQKNTKPKNQHTRHMTKTTRTGNMVSAKLLLWKSLELPVLGC